MKALFNFLPVILFFVFYKYQGLYFAIYAMIIASLLQVAWTKLYYKKYEKEQIISLIAIVIFGGLTLWLRNPSFVMWKVSVINLIFAVVLFLSIFIGKKTILERILSAQLKLAKNVWTKLTLLLGLSFTSVAIINVYFSIIAIGLRDKLINLDEKWQGIDLQSANCVIDLCFRAQEAEEAWVNFKLFGSLGITLITMIIMVIVVSKYNKKT